MILISHRGNINGSEPQNENNPEYIQKALDMGYDVEIDLRIKDNKLYLGHNEPQYLLDLDWFEKYHTKLWLHCKEIEVIEKLNQLDLRGTYLNYFWHENDTLTITSKGYLWAYPGKQPINNSIAVLPELNGDDTSKSLGVCSDYIINYKN